MLQNTNDGGNAAEKDRRKSMPKTARRDRDFDPWRASRVRSKAAVFLTTLSVLLAHGNPASAQSHHGCVDLDQSPVPSVEGLSGVFYRIDPDLLMDTRIPAATVQSLSDISRNLAARGTKLVYVPVPTKALVQPGNLGPEATAYGYDVRLARALYADSIAHLRAQEIATIDGLAALDGPSSPSQPVYFATDPRMSNAGLQRLADATAEELGDAYLGDTSFRTTEGEVQVLASQDRFLLQLACKSELPQVRSATFLTTVETEGMPAAPVAVVGSTITGGDGRNFAGFLSERLGRHVAHQSFAADAHAAMARYLTSDQFGADRPDLIVWLVPIWENPARFGDQPLREIAAAAADECAPFPAANEVRSGGYRFDLAGQTVSAGQSLRLENGDIPVTSAVFRFTSAAGQERVRRVLRREASDAIPQVYMPLSGLWPEGVASVTIELDAPSPTPPVISMCGG